MKRWLVPGLLTLIACSSSVKDSSSSTTSADTAVFSLGRRNGVALELDAASDRLAIDAIRVAGSPVLRSPSPLFQVGAMGCVWRSDVTSGPSGEKMSFTLNHNIFGDSATIGADLTGCGSVELFLTLVLQTRSDGNVLMTGVIENRSPTFALDGWTGPDGVGNVQIGDSPTFPLDADVTAVRSRMNLPYVCRESDDDDCARGPEGMQEEAFVIGNDGIIYGTYENDSGGFTPPTAIVDTTIDANRNVFPPGAPLVALRRNDDDTDIFSIDRNGHIVTFAKYAADDQAPWLGPYTLGNPDEDPTFPLGSPIAALVLHEEFDQAVNEAEVYVAGGDGSIYGSHMWNNGSWSTPTSLFTAADPALPCHVVPGSHLAALLRNHRQRDLFYVGQSGALCTAFRLRVNDNPPDNFDVPWGVLPLTEANKFVPGAPVAAAHGPGNDEFVFAIGAADSALYPVHERNDGPFVVETSITGGDLSPSTSSITAVRHTARDVAVAVAHTSGGVEAFRTEDGAWMATWIPALVNGTPTRKLFANMRNAGQLDVFGIGGAGDGRLFASTDAAGRLDAYLVFPQLLFSAGELAGNIGMVPMEMGGSAPLQPACPLAKGCSLGMPPNDDRANVVGVPEAMNMMEVAHVSVPGEQNPVSFFVADVSGPLETGHPPAQLSMAGSEIAGYWTRNLWPSGGNPRSGRTTPLPSILFGGYNGGDWHGALDTVAAPVLRAAPPPVDTPAWLRDAGGIYTFSGGGAGAVLLDTTGGGNLAFYEPSPGSFTQVINRMSDEASRLGTNVLYLYDYWEMNPWSPTAETCIGALGTNVRYLPYFCKGDYRVRQDYGGAPELASAIDALHNGPTSGKVILYVEPFTIGYGTDLQNQFGDLLTPRDPGGAMWKAFPHDVNVSYASSEWVDRLVQICVRLIRDTHADGIFLDSAGWRANERVETKGEVVRASPYENARSYIDILDRVRAAINDVEVCAVHDPNGACTQFLPKGQRVVLGENMGGPAANHMDGGLSSDFGTLVFDIRDAFGAKLIATPTRYARKSVNIFSNGQSFGEMNQVYAAGHNLALATNYEDGDQNAAKQFMFHNADYIKNIVTTRKAHAAALIEGDQQDLVTDNLEAIARYYGGIGDEVITIVNTGSSDLGVAVSNVPNPMGLPLRPFCDVVGRINYAAASDGTILGGVDLPPAQDICPPGQACGLRVLVPGSCN